MVDGLARLFVVTHDVVRTGVGAVVVVHRDVGVRFGHVAVNVVTGEVRRDGQQFEVHHVVDDDGIAPFLGVPRTGATHRRIEPRGEIAGGSDDHIAVSLVVRQTVAVTVGAVDGKADVVIVGAVLFALHAFGELFGDAEQVFAAAVFVEVPHRTREEAAGPPTDRAGDERIVGRIPAAGHAVGRILDRFVEAERLFDSEIERTVDAAHRGFVACPTFFGLHRCGEAEERKKQKFFHGNCFYGCLVSSQRTPRSGIRNETIIRKNSKIV